MLGEGCSLNYFYHVFEESFFFLEELLEEYFCRKKKVKIFIYIVKIKFVSSCCSIVSTPPNQYAAKVQGTWVLIMPIMNVLSVIKHCISIIPSILNAMERYNKTDFMVVSVVVVITLWIKMSGRNWSYALILTEVTIFKSK